MNKIKRVSINDFGNTLTEYEGGTSVYVCRYSELGAHHEDDPDSVETLDEYQDQFPSENWREVWPGTPDAPDYEYLIGTEVTGAKLTEIDRVGYDFVAASILNNLRTNADLCYVISPYHNYRLMEVTKR